MILLRCALRPLGVKSWRFLRDIKMNKVMAKKFWINTHTRVWLLHHFDKPLCLPCTGIKFVEWPNGAAVVHGSLPHAAVLNELQNGIIFEVLLHIEGGLPVYDKDRVILRLSNTRIQKRIACPAVNRPNWGDDMDWIELELILACDIELFTDVDA